MAARGARLPRGRDQQGAGGVRPGGAGTAALDAGPRPAPAALPLHGAGGLDQRPQRSDLPPRHLPPLLPVPASIRQRQPEPRVLGPRNLGRPAALGRLAGGDVARPPLRRGRGLLRQHLHRRRRLPLCAVHRQRRRPRRSPRRVGAQHRRLADLAQAQGDGQRAASQRRLRPCTGTRRCGRRASCGTS